jgi:hypothetical protein
VEDLLFERGIDVCHETVRLWWNRFGPNRTPESRHSCGLSLTDRRLVRRAIHLTSHDRRLAKILTKCKLA